jgi:hypothetical protein
MLKRLTQAGVINQRGIDGQNRDYRQDVQRGPMVSRLRTNLVAIRDANLAALC